MCVLSPRCKAPRLDGDHLVRVPALGPPLRGPEAPQQPGSLGQRLLPSSGHGRQRHGDWSPRPSPPAPGFRCSGRWPAHSPYIWEAGEQDCSVPVLVADGSTFVRGSFSVQDTEMVCFPQKGPVSGQQGPGLAGWLCPSLAGVTLFLPPDLNTGER